MVNQTTARLRARAERLAEKTKQATKAATDTFRDDDHDDETNDPVYLALNAKMEEGQSLVDEAKREAVEHEKAQIAFQKDVSRLRRALNQQRVLTQKAAETGEIVDTLTARLPDDVVQQVTLEVLAEEADDETLEGIHLEVERLMGINPEVTHAQTHSE